nr:M3 family metallopeptidase [Beutenbergia cavernae]
MTATTPGPDAVDLPADNPFAAPSALPYGLPDLAAVRIEHFRPAIAAGLAQQRAEWEAVATDASGDAPTPANTIEPLERSGRLLGRVLRVFFTYASAVGGDEIDAIAADVAPELSAHHDAFVLDARLFARYETIEAGATAGGADGVELDDETAWLLQRLRTDAVRAGVRLPEAEQERLRELNARLTSLQTDFGQRVVAGMQAAAVEVTDADELAGLGADEIAALAQTAADRGRDGYLVTMILPTSQPILTSATNRDLRARVHAASTARGTGGDADSDTRATLLEIVRLRAERAALLGYPHHAAYVAEDGTAKTTEAVMAMLGRLAPPAVRNAGAEADELRTALAATDPGAELAPSDWPLLADRVRAEQFAFDQATLRPYLELDRVLRDGVFFAANRLYGLTFTERPDLAGYADGVRVWEVREEDGTGLGLFVGDYYAREHKRGGAWMNSFVEQSHLLGEQPVVLNNLNVTRPPAGEPALLTWDEVITAFHEFGHALHGLFSDVRYPTLSGTSVPRDFVEYPSQVNEMWAWHPEVLARYARHHETGEPLDADLVERLRASQQYGEGFATTEYLGAALLDQAWHQLAVGDVPAEPDDVVTFEDAALERLGVAVPLVPPRYRSTYFNHTFGGGYDAGYYSYIWSEVLDADTVEWFREGEHGGLTRERGQRFREALLSRGHAGDPLGFYRELRGRDADITPLLVRRGLTG